MVGAMLACAIVAASVISGFLAQPTLLIPIFQASVAQAYTHKIAIYAVTVLRCVASAFMLSEGIPQFPTVKITNNHS